MKFNQDRELTIHSNFEDLSQAAINAIYLRPFPGFPDATPGSINRHVHGALHVTRCVMNAMMFIELYKKYKPELVVGSNGKSLTSNETKLLKLAVLYHDAANINDSIGDELEHSKIFIQHMQDLGCEEKEILPFAHAISHKDASGSKTFLQKIVHDADCLDILRIIRDSFDKKYLDVLSDLKEIPGFLQELDQIIANHRETIQYMEGDNICSGAENPSELHKELEASANCFLAVRATLNQMFFKATKRKHLYCFIEPEMTSILDLYNRDNINSKILQYQTNIELELSADVKALHDLVAKDHVEEIISSWQKISKNNFRVKENLCVHIALKCSEDKKNLGLCYSLIKILSLQEHAEDDYLVKMICVELVLMECLDVLEIFISTLHVKQCKDIINHLLSFKILDDHLNVLTVKKVLVLLFNAGLSLNSDNKEKDSLNFTDEEVAPLLCDIINSNMFSFDFLKWLSQVHPEPLIWDKSNLQGQTPLHTLVKFGCIHCLEFVLSSVINLNAINYEILRPIDMLLEIKIILPLTLSYNKRAKIIQLFNKYGCETICNGLPMEINDFSVVQFFNKHPVSGMIEPAPKEFLLAQQFKRDLGWTFINKKHLDADIKSRPLRSISAFGIDVVAYDYTGSSDYKFLVHTIRISDERSADLIATNADFLNSSKKNFSCSLIDKTHTPAVSHVGDMCFPLHLILDIPCQRLLCCYPDDISSPILSDHEFNERMSDAQSIIDSRLAMLGYFYFKTHGYIAPPCFIFNMFATERFAISNLPLSDIFATGYAAKLPRTSPEQLLHEKSLAFNWWHFVYLKFLKNSGSIFKNYRQNEKQELNYINDYYNELVVSEMIDNTKKIECKAFLIDIGFLATYMRSMPMEGPIFEKNKQILQAIIKSELPIVLINSSIDIGLNFRDRANILLGAYIRLGIALRHNTGSEALFNTKQHLYQIKADAIKVLTALVDLQEEYDSLACQSEPKYLTYFYKSLRSDLKLRAHETNLEVTRLNLQVSREKAPLAASLQIS